MASAAAAPPKSPSLPWKTRLLVSLSSVCSDLVTRRNGTLNRRLFRFFDFKSAPNPVKPIHGVLSFDVIVDSSRNLSVRVFTPHSDAPSLPILVFFHGGGFAFLSNASFSYAAVCRRLARRIPAVVLSVDYRLSPEHRFPCQYDDGFDVLRFLDHGNNTIGLLPPNADLSKCFLAGDSAGANLAHHVAVRFSRQKSQFQKVKIIGLISIQPFFGGVERMESETQLDPGYIVSLKRTDWLWRAFLPEGSDRDHSASNVSGPNAEAISELEEFPATVVFVAGFDPLKDRQRRYYEWLKQSGKKVELIEYRNMIHAFYLFPELPESSAMIDQVRSFVFKCMEA
ncbi:probable carboxylesterase 18 [Cucurbita pepo subsp. pepo]|uniref:probable carboxylesterase 18 n=1 Tax=Cucurbita pepo subsp. pepo TaxID=3664 RepID=UPI000C9D7083|nr:probable carboxylesterase 18 [Cucurbita pepo subsp. pepo]